MKSKKLKPQESVADFKLRLAAMLRGTHPQVERPCLRQPGDRGYYPPPRKKNETNRS